MAKANNSKKMRKVGRNSASCLAYKNSNRREKNKLLRLKKHLARFPDDETAKKAAELCKVAVRGY